MKAPQTWRPVRTRALIGAALFALVWSDPTPPLLRAAEGVPTEDFSGVSIPGWTPTPIGLTAEHMPIVAFLGADGDDLETDRTRLLLVGALDRVEDSTAATVACLAWWATSDRAATLQQRFSIAAVPTIFPPARLAIDGDRKAPVAVDFPPTGVAYGNATVPGAAYLWRWIGMHAPDLVIEISTLSNGEPTLLVPPSTRHRGLQRLRDSAAFSADLKSSTGLIAALVTSTPCATGTIPGVRLEVSAAAPHEALSRLLESLTAADFRGPSAARTELDWRLDRSPLEIAKQLSRRYGHALDSVAYIPAVALIGRLRLGELTGNPRHLRDVVRIVDPYRAHRTPTLPDRVSGSHLSGHLVFAELTRLTGDAAYIDLARRAADLGFNADGTPHKAMPAHSEMSDAVFMGCPILAEVGRLTGDQKYFDMCLRHMRFMLELNLRADGLHRHSPLDQAAWGRGNGFPALGLALSLEALPLSFSGREEMLAAFRDHMQALVRHQDASGAWHQVIDVPASYRELSSTCMITFALLRGIRRGWLDRAVYTPVIERSWRAIKLRVAADGSLVDVCTGTGKQKGLAAYFNRRAILGPDPRGGAMALLAATEMAAFLNATPQDTSAAPEGERIHRERQKRAATLRAEAMETATRATRFLSSISTRGGFAGTYSLDLKERFGEGPYEKATATEIWVQPPGTPSVGEAFLRLYRTTNDSRYLAAARGAGRALAWGQREHGGWDHRADLAHMPESVEAEGIDQSVRVARQSGHGTLDDRITQGALQFLMDLDTTIDAPWLQESIRLGLDFLLKAQFPNGAWPQWYPLRGGYHDYYTFNDRAINDCIVVLLAAEKQYGTGRYLTAARRAGEFIIASQLPSPQAGWAQQYSHDGRPAAARSFEPAGVCSQVTAQNIGTLVELYLQTGSSKFLAPIPPAIEWLESSKLALADVAVERIRRRRGDTSRVWARLYEVGTNRAIYGDRESPRQTFYSIFEISDRERRSYGWQGGYGIDAAIKRYRELQSRSRESILKAREEHLTPHFHARRAARLESRVKELAASLDRRGRWLDGEQFHIRTFVRHLNLLCDFLESTAPSRR